LDEYLGLSEEEEVALWDRLFKEAEQELTIRREALRGLVRATLRMPLPLDKAWQVRSLFPFPLGKS
jgi:hypothetical protein